ncbi:uncharacterized protein LOC127385898 isoform X2 [Apus apus]|uniref:uncharacterized protein LOC127385898 isoform X2 n=1 Tax=Apus apus TaxID=8895 RepID=UPI0021F87CDB|nr:uncharacterized protein LOC127385898 isoform X2 [Apus apus]
MRAPRAGLVLLVSLLIMPGMGAEDCPEGEYFSGGHCCVLCPADQITLTTCTLTRDTECQCKQGYFCPTEGCEICHRRSTTYPEGKDTVQNCNATTDVGCDSPGQGSLAPFIVVLIILGGFAALLLFLIRKLKSRKAASTDKDVEKGLESEGSTESLILPGQTPANTTINLEDEKSRESPEGQAQTNDNLEVKNTSPEENSVQLSELGTTSHCSWGCHMERCWRKITKPSPAAKTGQNPAFHQNAPPKVPKARMPAKHRARRTHCRIKVKDLSQRELRDTFQVIINEVPPKKWKLLMRTHLQENDISKIIYDFPNDREEQCYQMLLTWKNTLGEKQAIIKLLHEIRYLDIKAYDNVLNTLKSNNIITK